MSDVDRSKCVEMNPSSPVRKPGQRWRWANGKIYTLRRTERRGNEEVWWCNAPGETEGLFRDSMFTGGELTLVAEASAAKFINVNELIKKFLPLACDGCKTTASPVSRMPVDGKVRMWCDACGLAWLRWMDAQHGVSMRAAPELLSRPPLARDEGVESNCLEDA